MPFIRREDDGTILPNRDFIINGETLVSVKGPVSSTLEDKSELGLALGPVRILPRSLRRNIFSDYTGSDVPRDLMTNLADVNIKMTLIHYDNRILAACIAESMGRSLTDQESITDSGSEGTLTGVGTLMGGGNQLFSPGCHYLSLYLSSPVLDYPWRFFTCYLDTPPIEIPIGVQKNLVELNWKAIPYMLPTSQLRIKYISEESVSSKPALLWAHTDTTTILGNKV